MKSFKWNHFISRNSLSSLKLFYKTKNVVSSYSILSIFRSFRRFKIIKNNENISHFKYSQENKKSIDDKSLTIRSSQSKNEITGNSIFEALEELTRAFKTRFVYCFITCVVDKIIIDCY